MISTMLGLVLSERQDRKNKADLRFRSGLRLMVTAIPPRQWAKDLPAEFKASPRKIIEVSFRTRDYEVRLAFIKTSL